jgi:UDP-N-acetylmuramoylalanine--D-glutamate ligase
MIPVTMFAGRDVAVQGRGVSGLSAARALKAGGANPVLWDDKESAREEAATAGFVMSDLKTADWSRFASLVLAPGIPLTHPEPHWSVKRARQTGVEVIGDMELFFRQRALTQAPGKVVVITGTNGKSTTTALAAHLLAAAGRRVALGGNIGKAVLDLEPFAPDLT